MGLSKNELSPCGNLEGKLICNDVEMQSGFDYDLPSYKIHS